VDLTVGELTNVGFGQFDAELVGDVECECGVASTRHNNEAALGE